VPGSVVLDTAVGLVFVFLTASLICSAAIEWWGNKMNMRGEFLLRGLREMLDIPPATPGAPASKGTVDRVENPDLMVREGRRSGLERLATKGADFRRALLGPAAEVQPPAPLADLVLAHPVIAALHRPTRPGFLGGLGRVQRWERKAGKDRASDGMRLASYVSAQAVIRCLTDLLVPDGTGHVTAAQLKTQLEKLPDRVPAKHALLAMLRGTKDDVEGFLKDAEHWYDEQMGRVSGWYKRWAQWRLFVAGGLLALVLNVDTIAIGQTLYQDGPVRNAVVAQAVSAQGCPGPAGAERTACLDAQRDVLAGLRLPVGWDLHQAAVACRAFSGGQACLPHLENWPAFWWDRTIRDGLPGILAALAGWLLTAVAVAFGAPFWFDALSKLGSLRTAGRRPGENAPYNREPTA
jgi:hypothetical protein